MNNDINREISIENVEYNIDITNQEYTIELNPTESYVLELNEQGPQGLRGATGNGIASITKTGTVGLVDTYTILYTNGTSTTFTVTNGQNGSGSVADVLVNGTSVLDGQDAKILIKTINNNSITGNGNLDVGTVTSVNNVTPVSGNVTLSIPSTASDVGALPDSTKYGADLSYSSNTLQLLDQDGNSLGSPVTIQSSPDIDNKSITTNSSDELQTVGVIDQNNTTNAIKTWTGTKVQYDAIVTKDSNTLYNIIDDTDVTLPLLELLFPVGAVYFGTMSVCPLQTLGVGTWQALPQDKVIQIAGTRGSVGTTLAESLPNITGTYVDGCAVASANSSTVNSLKKSGVFNSSTGDSLKSTDNPTVTTAAWFREATIRFKASDGSSTYQNNAPVQQDAYLLNGWRRIA